MSTLERHTYNVSGMSCEHCVAAICSEVGELPGIDAVEVDLSSGAVVVHGSEIDDRAVRGAVEAAGYSLATSI
jgi:copper chaperone